MVRWQRWIIYQILNENGPLWWLLALILGTWFVRQHNTHEFLNFYFSIHFQKLDLSLVLLPNTPLTGDCMGMCWCWQCRAVVYLIMLFYLMWKVTAIDLLYERAALRQIYHKNEIPMNPIYVRCLTLYSFSFFPFDIGNPQFSSSLYVTIHFPTPF